MNNSVFRKTMKNSRKPKDIKLAITDERGNYLASEPNYHTTIFFFQKFINNRNEKTQSLWINKFI